MAKYWWKSSSKNNRGIHWKSWEKLTAHKSKGGMGFRNMHDFNLALLSKQGWRLLCRPNTLVAQIYKARYFSRGSFLSLDLGNNPSFIWRSIHATREIIRGGARRRVGNGNCVNIIQDPWLPCKVNPMVSTVHPSLVNQKVSALMIDGRVAWDEDLVRDMFNPRDAQLILNIPLSSDRQEDSWFWAFESSGQFSVKSTYKYLQLGAEVDTQPGHNNFWSKIWKLRVPPKVKDLLWRASSNCLPTKVQLRLKFVDIDDACPSCNNERETISHCLVECSIARASWNRLGIQVDTHVEGTFASWLEALIQRYDGEQLQLIAMNCWVLWRVRNDKVWKGKHARTETVCRLATTTLFQWSKAQDRFEVPVAVF